MIKTLIAVIIVSITSVAFADQIPRYSVDIDTAKDMKYDGVVREKTIYIEPKISEEKHIIIDRRSNKYPTGEVLNFDKWYEKEPDLSIDRYYCDEVDEEYDHVVCGLTKRLIMCFRAPCPQPEPAWKNYRSSMEACETGNIIEYIKQPCKSLPNHRLE